LESNKLYSDIKPAASRPQVAFVFARLVGLFCLTALFLQTCGYLQPAHGLPAFNNNKTGHLFECPVLL